VEVPQYGGGAPAAPVAPAAAGPKAVFTAPTAPGKPSAEIQWVNDMVASTGGRVTREQALRMVKKMDPDSRAHGILGQVLGMNFMLMLEKNPSARRGLIQKMAKDVATIINELPPALAAVAQGLVPDIDSPPPVVPEGQTWGEWSKEVWQKAQQYLPGTGGPTAGTPFDVEGFLDDIEMDEGIPLPGQ